MPKYVPRQHKLIYRSIDLSTSHCKTIIKYFVQDRSKQMIPYVFPQLEPFFSRSFASFNNIDVVSFR